jgi:aliphatic sulfonates family ABC transporter substrate-binding protein
MAGLTRRAALLGGLLAAPLLARPSNAATRFSIGYMKTGVLVPVKQNGTLDYRLSGLGAKVSWHEFPAGGPLMEALAANAIDFGFAGDTPPILAQAAGNDFVYTASQPLSGANQAILVRKQSAITTVAALRGARVATTKGTSAHNALIRILAHAGIDYGDVKMVFLAPADAKAAFSQGAVDAWATWDPYFAIAEADPNTRVLATGEIIAASNSFLLARRDFAEAHPALLAAAIEEVGKTMDWVGTHQSTLAKALSEVTGVPEPIQRAAASRAIYQLRPMTADVVAQQQDIAATFYSLRIIPQQIRVASAVWHAT